MIDLWEAISAFIRLPRVFLSMDFLFEKQIDLVIADLLYIRCTY